MAHWQIITHGSKTFLFSCEEHKFWSKDGVTICCITGYHSAEFIVETTNEQLPNFVITPLPNTLDILGINIYNCNNLKNVMPLKFSKSWHCEWQFPESMLPEECDRFEDGWDSGGAQYIKELGWAQTDSIAWVWGDIEILSASDQKQVKIINTIEEKN